METVGNIQASQGLATQALSLSQRVTQAIKQASAHAGVDFAYLLNNATQESGLNPAAKAKTSSATGLFQFVEQTWLRMVKTYGEKYGLGDAANRITIGSDGVARVNDPQAKQAILALRKDPRAASCMAAEFTNENKETLECKTGVKAGSTELYLAHFLGAGGAAEFINAMRANPNGKAAGVLPEAASANQSVFYDKSGQPRTLAQVYDRFAQKFGNAPVACAKTSRVASSSALAASASGDEAFAGRVTAADVGRSFAMASLTSPLAMSSFRRDATMSSPFAAMMLAQMDMGDLALPSVTNTASRDDEEKKKSTLAVLGIAG
ncbi:MAG: transglycosylase SLT domain-containing protein [Alphaproteobacteria bacterium]|nr:transglycosylase SLT domain-containing protein [Alphaproteobacteria bacterium]